MTQKALYLMSEKSNKPISQKLDEFRDFIYEISKSSCDSFASREECLKYDSNKAKREAQIQALKEKVRKASEKIQDRRDKDKGIEL